MLALSYFPLHAPDENVAKNAYEHKRERRHYPYARYLPERYKRNDRHNEYHHEHLSRYHFRVEGLELHNAVGNEGGENRHAKEPVLADRPVIGEATEDVS